MDYMISCLPFFLHEVGKKNRETLSRSPTNLITTTARPLQREPHCVANQKIKV